MSLCLVCLLLFACLVCTAQTKSAVFSGKIVTNTNPRVVQHFGYSEAARRFIWSEEDNKIKLVRKFNRGSYLGSKLTKDRMPKHDVQESESKKRNVDFVQLPAHNVKYTVRRPPKELIFPIPLEIPHEKQAMNQINAGIRLRMSKIKLREVERDREKQVEAASYEERGKNILYRNPIENFQTDIWKTIINNTNKSNLTLKASTVSKLHTNVIGTQNLRTNNETANLTNPYYHKRIPFTPSTPTYHLPFVLIKSMNSYNNSADTTPQNNENSYKNSSTFKARFPRGSTKYRI